MLENEVAEQGVRRSSHRRRGLTVWVIVVVAMAWIPAVAQAASLSLSPDKGENGTSFTVSGSGFSEAALVTVLWDGILPLGVAVADDDGSFSLSTRVPSLTSNGAHSVVATSLGTSASARFVVQGEAETTTTTATTTTTVPTTTTTAPAPTTTTTIPGTTSTTTTVPPPTTTTSVPPTTPTTVPPTTPTTVPPTTRPPDAPPSPTTTAPWVEVPPPPPTTTTTSPDNEETGESGSTDTTAPTEIDDTTPPESPAVAESRSVVLSTEAWIDRLTPEVMAATQSAEVPQLSGARTSVGDFTVHPSTVAAGSTIRLTIDFDEAVAGLFSVVFTVGEHQLGDPVEITGDHVDVRREVPRLPGRQVVQLRTGGAILGEAPIVIVDPAGAGSGLSTGAFLMILSGVALTLAALAVRALRPAGEYGTNYGLRSTLTRWRRRLSALRR